VNWVKIYTFLSKLIIILLPIDLIFVLLIGEPYKSLSLSPLATLTEFVLMIGFGGCSILMIYSVWKMGEVIYQNNQMEQQFKQNPRIMYLYDKSHDYVALNHTIGQNYQMQIEKLGFRYQGIAANDLFTNYIFIDEDNTISVDVRPRNPERVDVYFSTVFFDNFFLVTGYQSPLSLKGEGLQLMNIIESIPTTFEFHLYEIERLRQIHGEPVAVETIAQQIEYAYQYNERYTLLEFQTMKTVSLKVVMLVAIAALCYGIGAYGVWVHNLILSGLMWFIPKFTLSLQQKIPELSAAKLKKRKVKTRKNPF
jgi:hypothetical protein